MKFATDRKGAAPILIALILIGAALAVFTVPWEKFRVPGLSVAGNVEDSLKQEYTTYWADQSDADVPPESTENSLFTYSQPTSLTGDGEAISTYSTVTAKRDFYGQEFAVVLRQIGSGANVAGVGLGAIGEGDHPPVVKFVPRTLDLGKVDVYFGGRQVKTLDVKKPFYPSFGNNVGGDNRIIIEFIGYKSQFSCDLASDEVWVQEAFAQPFSINDLEFPATKFCKETRPFVLRSIQQGETAITPNPIPAFNRGEVLAPSAGSIVVVNYATPNVRGVTQPCDPDQANVKLAGKWVCSQVVKTTKVTREVLKREIIPVTDANSFTFNANPERPAFTIGDAEFMATQTFKCDFPEDVDVVSAPNPDIACYGSTVTFEGKDHELADRELARLGDSLVVQYFAGGSLKRADEGIKSELQGTYIFSAVNPIDIGLEGGLSFSQSKKGSLNLKVTNKLPANEIRLKVQQKVVRTNQNLAARDESIQAERGANSFSFDVDTSNLGVNEIVVQAFYPIDADAHVLLPSEKIRINVEVLGEQDSIVKFVEVEKPSPISGRSESIFTRLWRIIKALFS